MIRALTGKLLSRTLTHVVIDTGGVGYQVFMPMTDIAELSAADAERVSVVVHTHVRESAIELFGFVREDALDLFEQLISVSGVGPKTGLSILSGIAAPDLVSAVMSGDEARLVKTPGIGKKTAARIVLELRDKLQKAGAPAASSARSQTPDNLSDLESALSHLGYKAPQIKRALDAVKPLVQEGASLEVLVKESLQHV